MTGTRLTRRERRAIAAEWHKVSFRTRLEVARLAKRGERHPDDAVDALAVKVSGMALEERPPRLIYTPAFQWLMTLTLLVIAALWAEPFPRWTGGVGGGLCLLLLILDWDLKRDARRIIAVPRRDY